MQFFLQKTKYFHTFEHLKTFKTQFQYIMEDNKRKEFHEKRENDIIFSKAIKAGKRIYYLDVKKNKREELYLAITESKKILVGDPEDQNVQFEKHKIFLYKEDFDKFSDGFKEAIDYIKNSDSETKSEETTTEETTSSQRTEVL